METKPAQIVYRTFRENARDKKPLRHPKTPEGKRRRYPAEIAFLTVNNYTLTLYRTAGDNARLIYTLFYFCINKSLAGI